MNKRNDVLKINSKKSFGFYLIFKRIMDICLTLIFSPVILLLVILFALLVKIDSKGPAFYSQYRLGLDGKEFKLYKLRSMKIDSESETGAIWAGKNDPRITKIGKFIRKTRIDELPQFLNVFAGQMSIIGPRPERKILSDKFLDDIPNFEDRLAVKPGLTGLAQINGGYENSPSEKLKLDLKYIQDFSFKQDVKIFFKTFSVIFSGDGAR